MCEKHNKQALRHLLEIDGCDGWCLSADHCEEIINAVKNCSECSNDAQPEATYPYWYDGGEWMDKDENEVEYSVVKAYATS